MGKRVLVIGGTGMLGHMVYYYLKETEKYDVLNTVYRTKLTADSIVCDVRDKDHLKSVLYELSPDIIVNCVGALIQESKTNPANAIYLNAMLPHILKELADEINAKLIHVSTDCVFSGKKGNYAEDDFRDADDIYGRSKALGEIFDAPHCTLRTSIIGPELKPDGKGLFNWFVKQKGEVKGYTKAIWSGVTTPELARCMDLAISNNLQGLHHVTNGNKISKYHLLKKIQIIFNLNAITLTNCDLYEYNKSLLPSKEFNFKVKSYSGMLKEMKSSMSSL